MDTAETKTLAQMTAEIVECNIKQGWYDQDKPVSFGTAMALLHSEVSEALEAWREWGLEDATAGEINVGGHLMAPVNPKPEGVGSEFADIFIRLLDYAWRFAGGAGALEPRVHGQFALSELFPENLNTLHDLISHASWVWDSEEPDVRAGGVAGQFAGILVFLRQLCELYGVDLAAEYERKLAYNKTRGYRHGNKPI